MISAYLLCVSSLSLAALPGAAKVPQMVVAPLFCIVLRSIIKIASSLGHTFYF